MDQNTQSLLQAILEEEKKQTKLLADLIQLFLKYDKSFAEEMEKVYATG